MKYAVRDCKGGVVSVFDAESFGKAVEIKHQLECVVLDGDNIFSVGPATRKEIDRLVCEFAAVTKRRRCRSE